MFSLPISGQAAYPDPYESLREFTQQWTQAINDRDSMLLLSCYAAEVAYYTQSSKEAEVVVQGKLAWLAKHPDFKQKIDFDDFSIALTTKEDIFFVEFTKQSITDGKTSIANGILEIRQTNNSFLIIKETDRASIASHAKQQTAIKTPKNRSYESKYFYLRDSIAVGKAYEREQIDLKIYDSLPLTGRLGFYSTSSRSWTNYELESIDKKEGIYTFVIYDAYHSSIGQIKIKLTDSIATVLYSNFDLLEMGHVFQEY